MKLELAQNPEGAATEKIVLHLMTQDDQPYGSQRSCCDMCGVMILGWMESHLAWTDSRRIYSNPPAHHIACNDSSLVIGKE